MMSRRHPVFCPEFRLTILTLQRIIRLLRMQNIYCLPILPLLISCLLYTSSEKASYQFYRRLLYYYLDFRKRKMNRAARKIIHFLREEKYKIVQIYRKEYVSMGDRVRMQIALHIPVIYYLLSTLYSRFIIPLKQ